MDAMYMPTALDVFFSLVVIVSLVAIGWSNLPSRKRRRNSTMAGSGIKHVANFVLGMALCFGLVGLIAAHGGAIYRALDGKSFLGAAGGLGDEGFVGLLAFVVGVPVALAGSIYAVLLAYQSIALTERSIEYARKERVDRQLSAWYAEVAAIVSNFLNLANALQHMNALATSDMERMLFKLATLGRLHKEGNQASTEEIRAALTEVREHDSTPDLRASFGHIVQLVRNIQSHPRSCRLMESMISARLANRDENSCPQLFASQLLELGRSQGTGAGTGFFEVQAQRDWLAYAALETSKDERVDELVNCLSMLQIQAQRITPADLLVAAVRMKVDDAIVQLRIGEKVKVSTDIHEAFYGDWLSTVARKRDPEYFISYWLRTFLDISVRKTRQSGFGSYTRDVAVADVVVMDLHLLIPTRKELQTFLFEEAHGWDEFDEEAVGKLVSEIEYPSTSSISTPAQKWLNCSSVVSEDERSRYLLRYPFSPNPNELISRLGAGEAAFLDLWVRHLRKEAEEMLTGDLWGWRSSQGPQQALKILNAMGQLADQQNDEFNFLWHLTDARLSAGCDTALDLSKVRAKYDLAIESARRAGLLTPEREYAFLIESRRSREVVDRMEKAATAAHVVDWVEVVQVCLEGLLTRGTPIVTGDTLMLPEELAARDGLLPLFLWKCGSKLSRQPRLVGDPQALCGVVVCADPVEALPFDVETILDDLQQLLDELPLRGEGDTRHVDEWEAEWGKGIRESAELQAMLVPGA